MVRNGEGSFRMEFSKGNVTRGKKGIPSLDAENGHKSKTSFLTENK